MPEHLTDERKQCPTCYLTMPLTGICDECEDR